MNAEKQIKEITKDLSQVQNFGVVVIESQMDSRNSYQREIKNKDIAERLYNMGYCKQKEGEWLQDFDGDYYCPFCAHYPKEILNHCPNCGAKMKGE